jgi:hypothetical protein
MEDNSTLWLQSSIFLWMFTMGLFVFIKFLCHVKHTLMVKDQRHTKSFLFFNSHHSFFILLGRGPLWHLQKFLHCIKCIILQFTPLLLSFIPSPHSQNIFASTYMCTQYLHGIHPPTVIFQKYQLNI